MGYEQRPDNLTEQAKYLLLSTYEPTDDALTASSIMSTAEIYQELERECPPRATLDDELQPCYSYNMDSVNDWLQAAGFKQVLTGPLRREWLLKRRTHA